MDSLQQRLLFVVTQARPQLDYLDAVMTAALLNQSVSLLFMGEGLDQLRNPETADKLCPLLDLASLELFALGDGEQGWEGEGAEKLPVKALDEVQARRLFPKHDRILSF